MDYYSMNFKEVEDKLKTNMEVGLDEYEVKKRLEKYGLNQIKDKNKKSNLSKFLSQFNDFMVIILIIAGAISFFTSLLQGESDFLDAIIIIFIVVLNAILGFFQENKAEKALEALKNMSAPKTNVIRNGVIQKIESSQVVVGDLIIINNGDYVSADARLIESSNLKMEESALTGESLPVEKTTSEIQDCNSLGDRKNMVYAGSCAVNGKGKAIVVSTGMDTEMGKIAEMIMNVEEERTNLQKKLAETGKTLGLGALLICVLIFFIGILRKIPAFEMFMTSVSLAVAAIPEGLPAIVTIMLAIGVEKMVKQNAIVRKLPAVESLGSATVICSDKTGTLTQNKMTVVKSVSADTNMMCSYLALCNSVEVGEQNKLVGEPTEIGLVEFAIKNGFKKQAEEEKLPKIFELPFDSARKLMSTIHKTDRGYKIITKGALDILLNKCKFYYEDGERKILTENKRKDILRENLQMAKDALRVLSVAFKDEVNKPKEDNKSVEDNLTFLGLVGMIDPPREEVINAVKECIKAGIKPVMITGDHIETAKAIGKNIGILSSTGKAITGAELDLISEKELVSDIHSYDIFARVTPEHKVRIVKSFKKRGEIVAMTGDGVNDAPALKTADIGCAMGITGTDVAKGAADIILADDNFSTIVYAVREGRAIFENIKKSVHFLLSSNIGEIITILVALLFGFATPLVPIQLLWINLITDSLPAIALGIDPADETLMNGKKERVKKGLFKRVRWVRIVLEGIMIGLLGLIAYGIGSAYFGEYEIGSTMAFATLSISQLIHSFNMKSEKSIFSINLLNNPYLILAFFVGALLQIGVITVPFLAPIFKVKALNNIQWGIVAVLCFMPVLVVELEKLLGGKKIVVK